MKAFLTRLCALVCACMLCVSAVCPAGAADADAGTDVSDEPATTLEFVQTSIAVTVNQKMDINAIVSDQNTKIEWVSA